MTTVSPTPFAASSFGNGRVHRTRPPVRNQPSRTGLRRQSPLSSLDHGQGFSADAPMLQRISIGDSSDEDIPKPINFSALTKALLEDKHNARAHSPARETRESAHRYNQSADGASHANSRVGTPKGALRISRRSPPPDAESPPRVVHLSGSRYSSGLRRAASNLEGSNRTRATTPQEIITPAPQPRKRPPMLSRANSVTSMNGYHSQSGSGVHMSGSSTNQGGHASSSTRATSVDPVQQPEGENAVRSASKIGANDALPGSTRVKRIPLMRGAPVRRGVVRRRQSDDGNSPVNDELQAKEDDDDQKPAEHQDAPRPETRASSRANSMRRSREPVEIQDFARSSQQGRPTEDSEKEEHRDVPVRTGSESRQRRHYSPPCISSRLEKSESASRSAARPVYRVPDLPPNSINHDQENDPPPTFKKNKPLSSSVMGTYEKHVVQVDGKDGKALADTPANNAAKRPALATLSQNTPLRPAPPPPKMSVLDTATANAGASTVKSKKKRSHVIINGKLFTIRGRIGKGGSSDVYKVMAENDKLFAMKKVNLEDCNEDTVRGYKGEIELLKKLENVDRVIRLYDWEVNEQKQTLSVLMEMGESDLNKILATRIHPEDARLDLSFTRHYWREMLCCVGAVHEHDIVHSDLKPANFLLVSGRLKLIDFGIANAIDTDNTVNVHRETNVGTPNYMSPESLQDTNAPADGSRGLGEGRAPKLMKLGKPSDVWSLGCILYQMTYGKPPFAHISNQWHRVCAIINPTVNITYPATGIGGVFVPSCLRRLLQRCLNRDPAKRPTVEEMLSERETFLNPDVENEGAVPMTEGLLGQILMKIVERCKDPRRGFPTEMELLKTYPRGYMENIRVGLGRE